MRVRGGGGRLGLGLWKAEMRIRDTLMFFFSLPTYSLSLLFATMGVKKAGKRMLWSNVFMAVLLVLALLKFGMHALNCPSKSDAIDFRNEASWGLFPRRKMGETGTSGSGGDLARTAPSGSRTDRKTVTPLDLTANHDQVRTRLQKPHRCCFSKYSRSSLGVV